MCLNETPKCSRTFSRQFNKLLIRKIMRVGPRANFQDLRIWMRCQVYKPCVSRIKVQLAMSEIESLVDDMYDMVISNTDPNTIEVGLQGLRFCLENGSPGFRMSWHTFFLRCIFIFEQVFVMDGDSMQGYYIKITRSREDNVLNTVEITADLPTRLETVDAVVEFMRSYLIR